MLPRRFFGLFAAASLFAGAIHSAPAAGVPRSSGAIVFRTDRDGDSEIYAIDPTTRLSENLSRRPRSEEFDPAWSPDGNRIAYASSGAPLYGTHIFTMGPAGYRKVQLTTKRTIDREPAWSPDGTKIAFSRRVTPAGGAQIFLMKSDGGNQHALTKKESDVFDGSPAWSPDGTKLVFVSNRTGYTHLFQLTLNATGKVVMRRQLTEGSSFDGNPAWSPDGTAIAFDRCCPGGHSGIYVMDAAGTTPPVGVTQGQVEAVHPSWSPDGSRLALTGSPAGGGQKDIYTVLANGVGLMDITNDLASDFSPAWEPVTGSVAQSPVGIAESTAAAKPRADPIHPLSSRSIRPATVSTKTPRFRVRKSRVTRGLTLLRILDRRGPNRIFVLKVDPLTALTMDVALARNQLAGYERTTHMAARHHAIAAVNGEFSSTGGRPAHSFLEDGELKQSRFAFGQIFSISKDERHVYMGYHPVVVTAEELDSDETWIVHRWNNGGPGIGDLSGFSPPGGGLEAPPPYACSVRLTPAGPITWEPAHAGNQRDFTVAATSCSKSPLARLGGVVLSARPGSDESVVIRSLTPGETVRIAWSFGVPDLTDAIGVFPMLMESSTVVAPTICGSLCLRNPRTGIGVTAEGKLLLVAVDGRRPGYSVGMTLVQFAREFRRLGAIGAVNLDGGGSTTMVVKGRIVNRPTDPTGERPVTSAVLVLRGPDPGESNL